MICPLCKDCGEKSTIRQVHSVKVTEKPKMPTIELPDVYYDEEGLHHVHSPTQKTEWECSCKHRIVRTVRPPCPAAECDWGFDTYAPA